MERLVERALTEFIESTMIMEALIELFRCNIFLFNRLLTIGEIGMIVVLVTPFESFNAVYINNYDYPFEAMLVTYEHSSRNIICFDEIGKVATIKGFSSLLQRIKSPPTSVEVPPQKLRSADAGVPTGYKVLVGKSEEEEYKPPQKGKYGKKSR
jgi:hypothetical protein